MHKLGYKASPRSAVGTHDLSSLLRAGAAPLPPRASIRGYVLDVVDQTITSSCTSQATAQAIRCALVRQGVPHPELPSRLFIYWNTRAVEGTQAVDGGAVLADCFYELSRFGFCPETSWPFEEGQVNTQPQWHAYRAAADQRVTVEGYARLDVPGTDYVQAVKQALAAGHPVIGGVTIDDRFHALTPSQIWPGVRGTVDGGHAFALVGYDDAESSFTFVNSWGPSWCDSGFARLSYDALREFMDLWVISMVPDYSEAA